MRYALPGALYRVFRGTGPFFRRLRPLFADGSGHGEAVLRFFSGKKAARGREGPGEGKRTGFWARPGRISRRVRGFFHDFCKKGAPFRKGGFGLRGVDGASPRR